MWTAQCEPFKGVVIRRNDSEVSIPLGAAGSDISSMLGAICSDVHTADHMIYALENALQIHLGNGVVEAVEISLKEGPSSLKCLGHDYVRDLGNDIIADLNAASSGDILFGDVYIDCGIAISRPISPDELTREYEEMRNDDSWEDEFDTLSEFEEYYRGEIGRAQHLSSVLIGTAAYFDSYRKIQQPE